MAALHKHPARDVLLHPQSRQALMHRLMMADGTYRHSRFLHWARTAAYALIGIAGTLLILSPVFVPSYGLTGTIMSWFLVVGGYLASFGAASKRWFGEFAGLPLLSSAFLVFGLLSLRDSYGAMPYIAIANMTLLAGFATVMSIRWRIVLAVYQVADRFSGEKEDRE